MKTRRISIDRIDHKYGLRNYKGEPAKELVDSIKKIGLINPIHLWEKRTRYEVIDGWRRVLAHKKLGFKTIKAFVLPSPMKRILRLKKIVES